MEKTDSSRTRREASGSIQHVPEFRRYLKRTGLTYEEFEKQQDKQALGRSDLVELELQRRRLGLKKRK